MQDNKPLTEKQKDVLDFINNFYREKEFSPSLKEISEFLHTDNLSTAQYYVEELEIKGYLYKNNNKARGITPMSSHNAVPLLGYIAAGKPIEPIENPEAITVPPSIPLNKNDQYYALTVKGDSMIDMGILDKDIVLIRHQLTAKSGDIIVAVTEKGATLKILRKKGNSIYLEAKNKNFGNIYPEQLEIRGRFVGLIRRSN